MAYTILWQLYIYLSVSFSIYHIHFKEYSSRYRPHHWYAPKRSSPLLSSTTPFVSASKLKQTRRKPLTRPIAPLRALPQAPKAPTRLRPDPPTKETMTKRPLYTRAVLPLLLRPLLLRARQLQRRWAPRRKPSPKAPKRTQRLSLQRRGPTLWVRSITLLPVTWIISQTGVISCSLVGAVVVLRGVRGWLTLGWLIYSCIVPVACHAGNVVPICCSGLEVRFPVRP
jgi:hypothetical protein